MRKIGLVDIDSKLPNLAIMKLSAHYRASGCQVFLNNIPQDVEQIFISVLFPQNLQAAEKYRQAYPGARVTIGGTGASLSTTLPPEIEALRPDYDLYTPEMIYQRNKAGVGSKETKMKKAKDLVWGGQGFSTRGCIRVCKFCTVPSKEGNLHQVADIADLVNPRSNIIHLLDNNLTADPLALEKLAFIRENNLVVNISQGIDARCLSEELAHALGSVRHWKSLRFAWDQVQQEGPVMRGLQMLRKYIAKKHLMAYFLVGFDSSFEQDLHRAELLIEQGVSPYAMIYNKHQSTSVRLRHFARWINGRFYKTCCFEDFAPWKKARQKLGSAATQGELFAA